MSNVYALFYNPTKAVLTLDELYYLYYLNKITWDTYNSLAVSFASSQLDMSIRNFDELPLSSFIPGNTRLYDYIRDVWPKTSDGSSELKDFGKRVSTWSSELVGVVSITSIIGEELGEDVFRDGNLTVYECMFINMLLVIAKFVERGVV